METVGTARLWGAWRAPRLNTLPDGKAPLFPAASEGAGDEPRETQTTLTG